MSQLSQHTAGCKGDQGQNRKRRCLDHNDHGPFTFLTLSCQSPCGASIIFAEFHTTVPTTILCTGFSHLFPLYNWKACRGIKICDLSMHRKCGQAGGGRKEQELGGGGGVEEGGLYQHQSACLKGQWPHGCSWLLLFLTPHQRSRSWCHPRLGTCKIEHSWGAQKEMELACCHLILHWILEHPASKRSSLSMLIRKSAC